jgi:hypothetical protein
MLLRSYQQMEKKELNECHATCIVMEMINSVVNANAETQRPIMRIRGECGGPKSTIEESTQVVDHRDGRDPSLSTELSAPTLPPSQPEA